MCILLCRFNAELCFMSHEESPVNRDCSSETAQQSFASELLQNSIRVDKKKMYCRATDINWYQYVNKRITVAERSGLLELWDRGLYDRISD